MSEGGSSQKEILRSSSMIGGAAVINIAVGPIKTKVVAILLGPIRLGLISTSRVSRVPHPCRPGCRATRRTGRGAVVRAALTVAAVCVNIGQLAARSLIQ